MPEPTAKDGAALVKEAAQNPSLDIALMRDPRDVSDDDLRRIVQAQRVESAFVIKGKPR